MVAVASARNAAHRHIVVSKLSSYAHKSGAAYRMDAGLRNRSILFKSVQMQMQRGGVRYSLRCDSVSKLLCKDDGREKPCFPEALIKSPRSFEYR